MLSTLSHSNAGKIRTGRGNSIGCNGWTLGATLILLTFLISPSQAGQLSPDPNPTNGTINVTANTTNNDSPYTNNGTINVQNTAILTNNASATLNNYGTLATFSGGTLVNPGIINNTRTLSLASVSSYNFTGGTLNNTGTLIFNRDFTFGAVTAGTVNLNMGGTLINNAGATLTDSSGVHNNGTLYNYGTLTDAGGRAMTNDGGILYNYGTMTHVSSLFGNENGATLYNYGVFNSNSLVSNDAGFHNFGTLTNNNSFINAGPLTNEIGGTLTNNSILNNQPGFILTNYGTLTNSVGANLPNYGTLNNQAGAALSNYGTLKNGSAANPGTLYNYGTLTNQSGASINNPVGAIFTNQAGGTLVNPGIINNTGTLTLAYGSSYDFTGGTLNNAGTLNLNRDFTFGTATAGTVNLNAGGTLQNYAILTNPMGNTLGNYGTLSNGDVNNTGATLSNYGTLTNQSGATLSNYGSLNNQAGGSLVNSGTITNTGTLSLNSGSSYDFTGGTLTNTGTLNLNTDFTFGTATAGTVNLNAGGTLNNYATLTNPLGNSQSNAGALVNESGGTFVNNGTFTSTGTLSNLGTLKGVGNIIGNVTNGGTLAPGNSIGTLTVTGNYTHSAGAIYQAEINAAGNSDLLHVTGTTTLNGGTVDVRAGSGTYGKNTTYTILTSDKGVAGSFVGVTSNLTFLTPSLSYDANDVYLTMSLLSSTPTSFLVDFSSAAITPIQRAVAGGLDNIGGSATGDMANITTSLLNLSAPEARSAFDQMSGAVHTTAAAVTFASLNQHLGVISDRMEGVQSYGSPAGSACAKPLMIASGDNVSSDAGNAARDKQWSFWALGYGGTGQMLGDDIAAKYDYNMGGVVIGFDNKASSNFLLGMSTGYSLARATLKDLSDSARVASVHESVYGMWSPDPWYVNGIISYAFNRYNTSSDINFGNVARTANADYAGNALSAWGEAGYLANIYGLQVIPMAGLRTSYLWVAGFTESDAGALDLNVEREEFSSVQSSLGFRVREEFHVGASSTIVPEISARWLHEFADNSYRLKASFNGYPASAFSYDASQHNRDGALVGAGVAYNVRSDLSFSLNYTLNVSSDLTEHGLALGLNYRW